MSRREEAPTLYRRMVERLNTEPPPGTPPAERQRPWERVLATIDFAGPLDAKAIAAYTAISEPTVKLILARLQVDEYIVRTPQGWQENPRRSRADLDYGDEL